MLFEIQTIAPASSSSLAESVSGPPVTSESIKKPVCAIALRPSTATSAIPTARNSRDLPVDRARITDDEHHEQDGFEHRERPVRAESEVVRQEQRKHDRRDDGPDHRPARLADDVAIAR